MKKFGHHKSSIICSPMVSKNSELINTDRIIFKFLGSTNENPNGIDQIKLTIMRNDYLKDGM